MALNRGKRIAYLKSAHLNSQINLNISFKGEIFSRNLWFNIISLLSSMVN